MALELPFVHDRGMSEGLAIMRHENTSKQMVPLGGTLASARRKWARCESYFDKHRYDIGPAITCKQECFSVREKGTEI
jgi:hypothetical protein